MPPCVPLFHRKHVLSVYNNIAPQRVIESSQKERQLLLAKNAITKYQFKSRHSAAIVFNVHAKTLGRRQ